MRSIAVYAVLMLAPVVAVAQSARIALPDFSQLAKQAKETVDVTLDGDMLKSAGGFMAGDDKNPRAKAALNGLQGVYVRSYKFDHPDAYSMHDIETVLHQADGPGWKKLVSVQDSNGHVEIRMHSDGEAGGLLIVAAKPLELTIVNIVGVVDLAKLSGLQGLLGVPPQLPGVPGPAPSPPSPPPPAAH